MTKKRFLTAGGAVLVALALGTGLSAAQTTTTPDRPPATTPARAGDHDATHEQMRARMPGDMQAQCDTMHAQMGTGGMGTMHQGGMGPGMTGTTPRS